MQKYALILTLLAAISSQAHPVDLSKNQITAVYADLAILKQARIPVLFADENLGVGYAVVSGKMQQKISELAHRNGRCGNFEALPAIPPSIRNVQEAFNAMHVIQARNLAYSQVARASEAVTARPEITSALAELKSANIRSFVEWLSAYPTRYNRGTDPNKHVIEFQQKLQALAAGSKLPVKIDLISHKSTPQKSVRLSITGALHPDQYIVLGAHLDSINGWGGPGRAPGADDNASGSGSLVEALRVLLTQPQPQRTVEFMWYAGEESGLLGSAEIAETYKTEKKNVIAVLQLDMTMFPGDGEFKITSINDFTSAWLRDYLRSINPAYLNVEIFDDQCGYACSDHASWHRRGFPALMPTESKFATMFQYLHTEKDVISPVMSFEHSLVFSKIALVMAMDLGNSEQREPLF